jgi:outer membrane protein TolC
MAAFGPAFAQTATSEMTLSQAISFALAHHPSLRARAALDRAAEARTSEARSGLLPDLDLVLQLNRATGNVLQGALFPMRNIPNVSGPPRPSQFDSGVFGTAAGIGVSWDVVGLERRMALVDVALAEQSRTGAGTDARRLEVAFTVADRYLNAASRAETVKAARASVERGKVFATIVKALVDQSLRPGVDLSRAQAELALASTQLIRAEQAHAAAQVDLAEALGIAGHPVAIAPGPLLELPPEFAAAASSKNPKLREAGAQAASAESRARATRLEYLPRLDVVGALWARGSGFSLTGAEGGGSSGLGPDTPNWAAGLCLTWPALEMVGTRARSRAEAAQLDFAKAHEEEIAQAVLTEIEDARTILDGARRIAQNTPVALEAARQAEKQATARYKAGLATVIEVAEAQRLLAQAEIDDAVARLGVWDAMLLLARATGDLDPFLAAVQTGGR